MCVCLWLLALYLFGCPGVFLFSFCVFLSFSVVFLCCLFMFVCIDSVYTPRDVVALFGCFDRVRVFIRVFVAQPLDKQRQFACGRRQKTVCFFSTFVCCVFVLCFLVCCAFGLIVLLVVFVPHTTQATHANLHHVVHRVSGHRGRGQILFLPKLKTRCVVFCFRSERVLSVLTVFERVV